MKHKKLLAVGVILDLVFFYVLTRLHLEVLTKVAEEMAIINQMLTEQAAALSVTELGSLNSVLSGSAEFMTHYHEVMKLGLVFMIGSLVAWIVLQGAAWCVAQYMAGKPIVWWKYLGRYSIVSILASTVLFGVLFMVTGMAESGSILPLFSENEPFYASVIGIIIVAYFTFVLYANPTLEGFKKSFSNFKWLVLVYLSGIVLYGIGVVVGTWLFTLHWAALLLYSFLILLPSLSVARFMFVALATSKRPLRLYEIKELVLRKPSKSFQKKVRRK